MFHRKITSHTVTINAPRQWVWDILVDLKNYSKWNPFTPTIDGTLQLHKPLDLHVNMPKRGNRIQTEVVAEICAPHQLAWGMTFITPHLLSALRVQTLESLGEHCCSYSTSDTFQGALSVIVYKLFYNDVYNGFNQVAFALKARAETLWQDYQINNNIPNQESAIPLGV